MTGWVRGLVAVRIIVMPYLGVFVYLIAAGKMSEHDVARRARMDAAKAYIHETVGTGSPADELDRLVDLHEKGCHRRRGIRDDEGEGRRLDGWRNRQKSTRGLLLYLIGGDGSVARTRPTADGRVHPPGSGSLVVRAAGRFRMGATT